MILPSCNNREPLYIATQKKTWVINKKDKTKVVSESPIEVEVFTKNYIDIFFSDKTAYWNDYESTKHEDENEILISVYKYYLADKNKELHKFQNASSVLNFMAEHGYNLVDQNDRFNKNLNEVTTYYTFKKK